MSVCSVENAGLERFLDNWNQKAFEILRDNGINIDTEHSPYFIEGVDPRILHEKEAQLDIVFSPQLKKFFNHERPLFA